MDAGQCWAVWVSCPWKDGSPVRCAFFERGKCASDTCRPGRGLSVWIYWVVIRCRALILASNIFTCARTRAARPRTRHRRASEVCPFAQRASASSQFAEDQALQVLLPERPDPTAHSILGRQVICCFAWEKKEGRYTQIETTFSRNAGTYMNIRHTI